MRESVGQALAALRGARQAIWLEQPAELACLWTKKGARNQGATTLIRATRRLAELSTTMHRLRAVARQSGTDLGTLRAMTTSTLAFYADYFGGDYYGMRQFPEALRRAKEAVSAAETLEEYRLLVDELTLYTSRMDLWVFDVMIPWAKFGEAFDRIAAEHVAKR